MNDILYGIKNLIFYFKVIWNDRAWDYIYILELLDKKLEQIELHMEDKYYGKCLKYYGNTKIRNRLSSVRKEIQKYLSEGEISIRDSENLFRRLGRLMPFLWD